MLLQSALKNSGVQILHSFIIISQIGMYITQHVEHVVDTILSHLPPSLTSNISKMFAIAEQLTLNDI